MAHGVWRTGLRRWYNPARSILSGEEFMFQLGAQVEIISDGRIGTIKEIHTRIDGANLPGAMEVADKYKVGFGNDMTKIEYFNPEQIRAAK
jgi:hypothetical protein